MSEAINPEVPDLDEKRLQYTKKAYMEGAVLSPFYRGFKGSFDFVQSLLHRQWHAHPARISSFDAKETLSRVLLCARQFVGIFFTHKIVYTPGAMYGREGFDLGFCRLIGGDVLVRIPHERTSGMICSELEGIFSRGPGGDFEPGRPLWVKREDFHEVSELTVTGRHRICIKQSYNATPLSPFKLSMIQSKTVDNPANKELHRHYHNRDFMSLLNLLWDYQNRPPGFVERWALRGPSAVEEMWAEVDHANHNKSEKLKAMFAELKIDYIQRWSGRSGH